MRLRSGRKIGVEAGKDRAQDALTALGGCNRCLYLTPQPNPYGQVQQVYANLGPQQLYYTATVCRQVTISNLYCTTLLALDFRLSLVISQLYLRDNGLLVLGNNTATADCPYFTILINTNPVVQEGYLRAP